MDIFLTKTHQFATGGHYSPRPPEPCEACFVMDGCALFDYFWTVEQKHPPMPSTRHTDTILQRATASQSNSPKTTLSETNCSLYLQPAVTCVFVLLSLSAGFSSGSDPETKFLYIQMEFCEGDTLHAWIDKRNSSDVHDPERRKEAAQINRQVLKAVEYIHKEGLIHRDLKPLNIMFSSEGTVKVGDFGLVTAAENDNDQQLLVRTKRTGTRIYMSPEQANQTSYDRKVDIYALGLIYFELIWNLFTLHERKKV
uniref:Protein kinase domain-containing protein n=1 Tax=Sinocyclocheilus grahami TaxID=75366 RepID=A0A672P3Z9_SINGR